MSQPKCYIISHTSSQVVSDCVQSLELHSWPYEVVPAVDGNTVTQADWNRIGILLSTDGKIGRRPGAQGCWHSHFGLWQRCIDSQQPMIIMEHDALVQAPWPPDIDFEKQIIKLYSTAECKQHPVYGLWSKGSHAYTVTPSQAKRLIDHARQNSAQAVDKHLGTGVQPWTFYHRDLVTLNSRRGASSTSKINRK